MITFVEHDAEGFLVHIAEVHTTEGRDVAPEPPGLTPEQKAERKALVDAAIAQRETNTRAELAQAATPHAGLIVLPKNADRPTHDGHKVDMATKKVRPMTGAEKIAWAKAHAPTGTPANP